MDTKEYRQLFERKQKKSTIVKDCVLAFIIGGAICTVGQAFLNLYVTLGIPEETAKSLESVTLVFLSAFFTGIGFYDSLAKHAGAGSLVPITGFANAVVSPAMEFKTEGLILGTAPKMFIIAGPVIVFGITSSVIYGIILYVLKAFGW